MPTFDVQIRPGKLIAHERRLRIPAPDATRARHRGARRALALAQPGLGPTVGAEEFHRVANHVAATQVRV